MAFLRYSSEGFIDLGFHETTVKRADRKGKVNCLQIFPASLSIFGLPHELCMIFAYINYLACFSALRILQKKRVISLSLTFKTH